MVTVSTVGYGDVLPTDNLAKAVTCVFIVAGSCIVSGVFGFLVNNIYTVHHDRALQELIESGQAGQVSKGGHAVSTAL